MCGYSSHFLRICHSVNPQNYASVDKGYSYTQRMTEKMLNETRYPQEYLSIITHDWRFSKAAIEGTLVSFQMKYPENKVSKQDCMWKLHPLYAHWKAQSYLGITGLPLLADRYLLKHLSSFPHRPPLELKNGSDWLRLVGRLDLSSMVLCFCLLLTLMPQGSPVPISPTHTLPHTSNFPIHPIKEKKNELAANLAGKFTILLPYLSKPYFSSHLQENIKFYERLT